MKNYFPLLLIIVTFASCSKEKDSSFVIGVDNDSMNTFTLDSAVEIIAPALSVNEFELDIDNDGINDFKLVSEHNVSSGGVNQRGSFLIVLNTSFLVSTTEMIDTTYQCYNFSLNSTTTYNNFYSYSCLTENDSIQSINIFEYPKVYSSGDSYNCNESWLNSELILSYLNNSSSNIGPPYSNHNIVRGNWNLQNMKYILISKDIGPKSLYGWIKLSVENFKEIQFIEYSLQKE